MAVISSSFNNKTSGLDKDPTSSIETTLSICLLLKDELMTAIKSMDDYIKKFKQEKQEAYDKDWHQKVRRKQQVCKAFLSQLISLDHDESLFRSIYDKHFSQIILEYIDRNDFRTIHNKARSLAIAELEKIT